MIKNYTHDAKQRCLALADNIEDIWKLIEHAPEDTNSEKWRRMFEKMAREYSFSSRFALMRIFLDRADASQLIDSDEPSRGFAVVLSDGTECRIEDITMEHAGEMTEEELFRLEKVLMDQASVQSDADCTADFDLIKKALLPVKKTKTSIKTTLLTRDEAFRLGHSLQLTLQEMEWFLLRVFDVEDGFSYNTSEDLIEAYGFLTGSSSKEAAEIKKKYIEEYAGRVQKADCEEKEEDWTRDAGGSLPEMVRSWTIYDRENRDARFLEWLGEKERFLDLPSKTALRIYRNLAVWTYNLAVDEEDAPDVDCRKQRRNGRIETDFVRCVREIVQAKDLADQTEDELFENSAVSTEKCKKIADELLLENKYFSFSDQSDNTKAWHVIQVLTDGGKLTVSGGINESRTRVRDILAGRIERIEKSDMLYLLWFASNLCWFGRRLDLAPEEITNRLLDFIDASEICLNEAGLPEFYPPHLVEQSMMLSVVYAMAGPERCDPAEVYEKVCASLIKPRAKHTNKRKDKSN